MVIVGSALRPLIGCGGSVLEEYQYQRSAAEGKERRWHCFLDKLGCEPIHFVKTAVVANIIVTSGNQTGYVPWHLDIARSVSYALAGKSRNCQVLYCLNAFWDAVIT